jgi:Fe-S-cluster containining protein
VGLYFEYKLYRANRTTKVSSEQFEAFESANYPHLGESGVHLNFNEPWLIRADTSKPLVLQKNLNANVLVLKLFPGISKSVVTHILNCPDLEGVILETYGAGNAPTAAWFSEILIKPLKVIITETGFKILDYYLDYDVCPFLNSETNKCNIYESRPQICRDFPFLKKEMIDLDKYNIIKSGSYFDAIKKARSFLRRTIF